MNFVYYKQHPWNVYVTVCEYVSWRIKGEFVAGFLGPVHTGDKVELECRLSLCRL